MVKPAHIPVVIFCGGIGTRLREETEFKPKPMVEVGGKPIIWHIMKHYSYYGFKNFILLLGYKGEEIKSFFLNYKWRTRDFRINLATNTTEFFNEGTEDWKITLIDTGVESLTEKRLYLAQDFLKDAEIFMLTYGDGVSDVNLHDLLRYHIESGFLCTITGVNPTSKYGKITHKNGKIEGFFEKPVLNDLINGGFMVMNADALNYLSEENEMIERSIIPRLVNEGKIGIYQHNGFWHCMDTFRDKQELDQLWLEDPKWKVWKD